jgi:hypothetical protein
MLGRASSTFARGTTDFWQTGGRHKGNAYSLDCGSGNVLVGIVGYADGFVNDVAPLCNTAANVLASTADATKWSDERAVELQIEGLHLHGGTGGTDGYVECPRQQFLVGLDISADSRVNRIQAVCARAED